MAAPIAVTPLPAPSSVLRAFPDSLARVRAGLSAVGVYPEPWIEASDLSNRPTSALALVETYGRVARALDRPGLGFEIGGRRDLGWLAPVWTGLPDRPRSMIDFVLSALGRSDRLLEGQHVRFRVVDGRGELSVAMASVFDPDGAAVVAQVSVAQWGRFVQQAFGVPASTVTLGGPGRSATDVAGMRVVERAEWTVAMPLDTLGARGALPEDIGWTPGVTEPRPWLERVVVGMLMTLAGGARLADVARLLGMAPRTLQVRLAATGWSYGDVLTAVRCAALDIWAPRGAPRARVAPALGFRSPEALARFVRTARVSRRPDLR